MKIPAPARPLLLLVLVLTMLAPAAHAALLGIDYDSGTLFHVSESNAARSAVGPTGVSSMGEIEYNPYDGKLYGFDVGAFTNLYTINPATAAASTVGSTGLSFIFEGGLAFGTGGVAYATNGGSSGAAQLLTLNLATGAATSVGVLAGEHDIDGLAWRGDGKLIGLDRVTNALLVIDPSTLATSLLMGLTPLVGGIGGMTVDGGVGYFNTGGPGGSAPGSDALFSFDLYTGSYSLVGNLGTPAGSTGISGLAAIPSGVPEPGSFGLFGVGLGLAALVLVNRRRS